MSGGRGKLNVELPPSADFVVIGGGTAGAIAAGRLAAAGDASVLLLEAGPDYGAFAGGGWPADLLDARFLPEAEHDWDYTSDARHGAPQHRLDRARVIGGCSAHNGCAAIWGSRADYDGWAARGNPGWATETLLPLFQEVDRRLRVRQPDVNELTPWQAMALDAATGAGVPWVESLNDLDQDSGMAPTPANVVDGVRWNSAFAYLDPVRARPNLTIAGSMHVDRLEIAGSRAVAVIARGLAGPIRLPAGRVVLAGGTYGSAALLLRSGVGPAAELRALGIAPRLDRPGVGRNLHDHPAVALRYRGTDALVQAMCEFGAHHWLPEEQTIAKARSRDCRTAFDLHLYPVGGPLGGASRGLPREAEGWYFGLTVAVLTPRSRGALRLRSPDPDIPPAIDTGYFTDEAGEDSERLLDGIDLARAFAAQPSLARLCGEEMAPGPRLHERHDLAAYLRRAAGHYFHPVGTCTMGPAADAAAVVDAHGRVHGLDNVYVCDASIMPVIPRANTNIPAAVVAERVVAGLLDGA